MDGFNEDEVRKFSAYIIKRDEKQERKESYITLIIRYDECECWEMRMCERARERRAGKSQSSDYRMHP